MKKKMTTIILISISIGLTAQVGINTTSPKTTMDINGVDNATHVAGLQAPRLTLLQLTDKGNTLYGNDQKGALVYIYDISVGTPIDQRVNISEIGYYYFDGSLWQRIANQETPTSYTGSTSVVLTGGSFQRAALTGDITAAQNSNTTTIANNAVTSAKILDGTIVTADLADNAVTSAKIVDGTIATADLADNAVTSAKIVDGTIVTADLANTSVTAAKIVPSSTVGQVLTTTSSGVVWQDATFISKVGVMRTTGTLGAAASDISTGSITLTPGTWMVSAKYSTVNSLNNTYFTWLYLINATTGARIDSVGTVPETTGDRYATPYLQVMMVVTANTNIKVAGSNSCLCAAITTNAGLGHFFAYKMN